MEKKKRVDYCPYGVKPQWKDYNEKHPNHKLKKNDYTMILRLYHDLIIDSIINGGKIRLGVLGDLYVKRIEQTPQKKVIYWKKTMELRAKNNSNEIVYVTGEPFFMIRQNKRNRKGNSIYYKFFPARGTNSFVKKLAEKVEGGVENTNKFVTDEKRYYIEQLTKHGVLVQTYLTINDIIRKNPTFKKSNIIRAINNPSLSSYGYKWNSII
jgi:nucleoid DNA-binding protein